MEKIIEESKQGESLVLENKPENTKKLFIESYGCAMNFSDSEIVASILSGNGYNTTQVLEEADLVLVNTCSIRDKAEQTIRKRLEKYNAVKRINPKMKVGVLGCMAERLKSQFLEEEKIVDLVVGPDAYKDLPNLLQEVESGHDAINVILSKDETYGDISPVRLNSNGISAFVSITRGCDNMCTFCVVPFTRGRERSREPESIIAEIQKLWDSGYKEITLLGQNVDSYLWYGGGLKKDFANATDFAKATAVDFAQLLETVAVTFPKMRIRFSTSNPQDMHEPVLHIIAKYHNICKHIHLPVQSGSDRILKAMNRLHTREEYFNLIDKGLYSKTGVNGSKISLGMQKIIMIIRGILKENKTILIFDEPLTSLDIITRKKIVRLITEKTKDKTVIIISHDKEIIPHADNIIHLT